MSDSRAAGLARTGLVLGTVLVLAACTLANPFVGEWLDADGRPVPDASVEGEGLVLKTWVVTGHCEWGAVTFMLIAWPPGQVDEELGLPTDVEDGSVRQYVRDPEKVFEEEGIFSGALAGDFDADAELPASAVATGLHHEAHDGRWEIWTGDDQDALYVVGPDRTERWQRARDYIGCM